MIEDFKVSGMYKQRSKNLTKLGFDFSLSVEEEYLKIQELLFNEYHVHQESMLSIMKKYDISSTRTIDILFRLFNIQARSISEGNRVGLETNRLKTPCSNKYNQTWHTTWDGRKVFLRSSYELAYAKILDEEKIAYYVEYLKIKYYDTQQNTFRLAVPDFYLPEFNRIVEIKSNYTLNVTNMKDKFKYYSALGFDPILILEKERIDLNVL